MTHLTGREILFLAELVKEKQRAINPETPEGLFHGQVMTKLNFLLNEALCR